MSIARQMMMAAAGAGGGGGVEVIFHGASATADTSQTATIDFGTPQAGDYQIIGLIGQESNNNLTLTAPANQVVFRADGGSFDALQFCVLDSLQTGETSVSASATYRNTIFAWTIRGAGTPLFDTAYSYTTTVSDSISVSADGAVLAMSTAETVSLDVHPDIVEVSDAVFPIVEGGFNTSGGHSAGISAQTIPLIATNSTVARSMIGAISFQRA